MTEPDETRWERLGQNRLQQEDGMEINWTRWDRKGRDRTGGGSMRGGRTELEGDETERDGTERNGIL